MDWRTPENIHIPQTHTAHIWRLRTEVNDGEQLRWYSLLSQEEKKRVDTHRDGRGMQYTAIRGQLRELLSSYLGIPPGKLILDTQKHGKPELATGQNPHALHFNLSHSGNCALLVIACNTEVGIDIEAIRPKPYLEIARRFFHEQEYLHLSSQDQAKGLHDFFRYWTIKEAILKAMGTGLQFGLDKIYLNEPESSQEVFQVCLPSEPDRRWEIHRLCISDAIIAAVALQGSHWKLEYFTPASGS